MRNIPSSSSTDKMIVGLIVIILAALTAPAISNLMLRGVVAEINPPPPGEGQIHYHNGDWVIEPGDNVYRGNQTIVLKGNLTILGGTLTLQNVTLMMNSTEDGEFEINVTANGKFLVYHSNITAFDTTTPVEHNPVTGPYTSYGLRYRFRVYGNMTIENSNVSYMGGEEQYTLRIGGIEIYSDNVTIHKSRIFKGDWWVGIYCYQASPTVTNNILSYNWEGIYLDSSGGLIAYNNLNSNGHGIQCRFSSPSVIHNSVTFGSNVGIALTVANATVTNNHVSDYSIGIRVQNSNPYIANNTLVNNDEGIYFNTPTAGITINNTIKDNANRGVWTSGSANPVIINSTVKNNGNDFWALGSFPTALNTTFDDTKLWMDSFSTLTVRNYLQVLVLDATSTPIPGADINVTDNGNPIYQTSGFGGSDPQTGGDGFVRWMVVTDRIYIGSTTATENITTAEVSYPPKTFIDNPRDVNMYASHPEVFIEAGGTYLPDFVLTKADIDFNPPDPVKDKTLITIKAAIHNIGLKEGRNIVVRFYDGVPPSNTIGEDQIRYIPALGGVESAEMQWAATPFGVHKIYVAVDPDNLIVESDEKNNVANRTIGVGVPLYEGWNLISIPYTQPNTNLGNVLSSITGYYNAVQWYNAMDADDHWKHNCTSKPSHLNDLDGIDHTKGFWIYITKPGETIFVYNGAPPTENQSIPLHPGWNLVGYPSITSYNRTDGLNNVTFGTDVDAIWTYNATTQKWKEIGETDYFEVGRGFWIHAKFEKTWEVPI